MQNDHEELHFHYNREEELAKRNLEDWDEEKERPKGFYWGTTAMKRAFCVSLGAILLLSLLLGYFRDENKVHFLVGKDKAVTVRYLDFDDKKGFSFLLENKSDSIWNIKEIGIFSKNQKENLFKKEMDQNLYPQESKSFFVPYDIGNFQLKDFDFRFNKEGKR